MPSCQHDRSDSPRTALRMAMKLARGTALLSSVLLPIMIRPPALSTVGHAVIGVDSQL
jgi:hypothetical protein